jgi:hypothetical protein
MARTRKAFLAAATSLGAGLALTGSVEAQTPSDSPSAKPTASPSPSPAARELALRMRKFDPNLTDAQIDLVAAGIDQGFDAGKSIRKHHALLNGEGPSPEFAVEG